MHIFFLLKLVFFFLVKDGYGDDSSKSNCNGLFDIRDIQNFVFYTLYESLTTTVYIYINKSVK